MDKLFLSFNIIILILGALRNQGVIPNALVQNVIVIMVIVATFALINRCVRG